MTEGQYKRIQENIPNRPGVYFWKKGENILYIGKATNLKQRTASYLQKNLMARRGPLVTKMIEDSDVLDWRETESVLEALMLESFLIKKHQPVFNSKEKDNKSHNYIVITNDVLPRVYTVRGRMLQSLENKGSIDEVFGPFPQGALLREALGIIKKIFPFLGKRKKRDQGQEFYKQLGYIPDTHDEINQDLYRQNISFIKMLFQGKKRSIIAELKRQMKNFAADLAFEDAARVRNKIYALEHIRDIALMKHDFETAYYKEQYRIEAYDIAHLQGDHMIGVMVVHNGVSFEPENYRVFTIKGYQKANDPGALDETLTRRIKHLEWVMPDMIVVDGGMIQKRRMEKVLRDQELRIPVVAVVKDDKHKAKGILGKHELITEHQKKILAINEESHRFAITQHQRRRRKSFLE